MYSFLSIPIFLAAGFLIPLIGSLNAKNSRRIALIASFLAIVVSLFEIPSVLLNKISVKYMSGWMAPYGISVAVDAFSLLFIILASVIGFLVVLYSKKYITSWSVEYYTLLMLLFTGVMGVLHAGDLFNLFVFFEILSIASYALTAFHKNKKSLEGAIKYLILGSFTASFMLLGIAIIYGIAGTLNMADLAGTLGVGLSTSTAIAFGLIFAALAFKSAIVPFHYLKSDILEVTIPPVGAFFASIVSATGIYAIMRLYFTVFGAGFLTHHILIILGVASIILGSLMALKQKDIMRLLAYSAIAQVGFVVLAFGMGALVSESYTAAIYHLMNIIFIDALLFLSAGVLVLKHKTTNMEHLQGVGSVNPILSYGFLIGALANAGVPLTNGFASKWLIYAASIKISPILTIITIVASAITLAYSLKAYSVLFLSNAKNPKTIKIDGTIIFPIVFLCIICIALGIFYTAGISISEIAATALLNNKPYILGVLG